jgi:hypothetical protein
VNLEVFLEKIFVSRALATLQGKHLNRSSTKLRAQEKLASACLQVPKIPSVEALRVSIPGFSSSFGTFALWWRERTLAFKNPSTQTPYLVN